MPRCPVPVCAERARGPVAASGMRLFRAAGQQIRLAQAGQDAWIRRVILWHVACSTACSTAAGPRRPARTGYTPRPEARPPWGNRPECPRPGRGQRPVRAGDGPVEVPFVEVQLAEPPYGSRLNGMIARLSHPEPFFTDGDPLGERSQFGHGTANQAREFTSRRPVRLTEALESAAPLRGHRTSAAACDRPTIVTQGIVGMAEVDFAVLQADIPEACRAPGPAGRTRWRWSMIAHLREA